MMVSRYIDNFCCIRQDQYYFFRLVDNEAMISEIKYLNISFGTY